MRRRWAVEIGEVLLGSAAFAWLFNAQLRPDQLVSITGAMLVAIGLIALLQRVDPFAGMLDRVGLGPPRTSVERRLSFAVCLVTIGSAQVLHLVGGDRPGYLFSFAWITVTFTVATGFYRAARRLALGAAF
jgi:hypothetical protein